MPKGYMIAQAIVTNPSAWAEYAEKSNEAARAYIHSHDTRRHANCVNMPVLSI